MARAGGDDRLLAELFGHRTVTAADAVRIGLAESVVPDADFDAAIAALAKQILANSTFSHAANKRLLDATDARDMDSGLAHEVYNNEGVGPDMRARINAFMKKA